MNTCCSFQWRRNEFDFGVGLSQHIHMCSLKNNRFLKPLTMLSNLSVHPYYAHTFIND